MKRIYKFVSKLTQSDNVWVNAYAIIMVTIIVLGVAHCLWNIEEFDKVYW